MNKLERLLARDLQTLLDAAARRLEELGDTELAADCTEAAGTMHGLADGMELDEDSWLGVPYVPPSEEEYWSLPEPKPRA